MEDQKDNLPAIQSLDMAPAAIRKRSTEMATRDAVSPLHGAACALTAFQYNGDLIDPMVLEGVLLQRLTAMKQGKDAGPLAELLYGEILTLDGLFKNLLQLANAPDIHPERKRGLLELSLKAQRQARATMESLASLIAPKPVTLIQNNTAGYQQVNNTNKLEINNHEG